MGIKGHYALELTCDRSDCGSSRVEIADEDIGVTVPGERTSVVAEDHGLAMVKARSLGWKISTNRVTCPACAKRRTTDGPTASSSDHSLRGSNRL
jgi:hypothetical protein